MKKTISLFNTASNTRKILFSAFLAGISFPGNSLGLMSFISYIPLLYVLYHSIGQEKKRTFFKYGFLFGSLYSIVSMYWIALSNWQGFLGATIVIAVRYGLMTFLFGLIVKSKRYFFLILPMFLIQEYFCSVGDLDYTWHLAGYSLTDFPFLCQMAEYTGVYGLSLVVYLLNMLLFLAYENRESNFKDYLVFGLRVIVLFLLLNTFTFYKYDKSNVKAVKVAVLQPNIDPFVKWKKEYKKIAVDYFFKEAKRSAKLGADHIVYPETAFPFYVRSKRYKTLRDTLHQIADSNQVSLVVGAPDINFKSVKRQSFNAALHILPGDESLNSYKKQKLVPVAEKVVYPEVLDLLGNIVPGMSGWGHGVKSSVYSTTFQTYSYNLSDNKLISKLNKDSLSFSTSICIESTFPEFFTEFKRNGAQWVNIITNDGWFFPHWAWFRSIAKEYNFSPYFKGKGAFQHNQIAILRAIENRLSIVRSANTGVSSIIDPFGYMIAKTEQYEEDVIINYVPILSTGQTLYSSYGNWLIYLSMILFVFFGVKSLIYNRSKTD